MILAFKRRSPVSGRAPLTLEKCGAVHRDACACFTVAAEDFCRYCHKFAGMANKWLSNNKCPARSVSAMLFDFVFGEPRRQPEVVGRNDAQAWLDWLHSMADHQAGIEFEDTLPSALEQANEKRLTTRDS